MSIKDKIRKIKYDRLSEIEKISFYIQESKKLIKEKNIYVELPQHSYKGKN